MGCDVWLSTYGHVIVWAATSDCPHTGNVIVWAVTSDCPHTGTSLHGLWHLTVHIWARHCMGCDIWLSTYGHVIVWAVTSDCPHTGTSLHGPVTSDCPHTGMSLYGLWHLTVHIRACHCMGCNIWLSTYGHVIVWAVTSDCPHTGMSLYGLWRHIRACYCMGCDIWLSTYGHVIAWRLWRTVLLLFYISVFTHLNDGQSYWCFSLVI